jgi:hypothetical protein
MSLPHLFAAPVAGGARTLLLHFGSIYGYGYNKLDGANEPSGGPVCPNQPPPEIEVFARGTDALLVYRKCHPDK